MKRKEVREGCDQFRNIIIRDYRIETNLPAAFEEVFARVESLKPWPTKLLKFIRGLFPNRTNLPHQQLTPFPNALNPPRPSAILFSAAEVALMPSVHPTFSDPPSHQPVNEAGTSGKNFETEV